MRNQTNYNCTQQELYAVAHLGWKNYKDNVPDFTNHKGNYTLSFGEEAIAALIKAANLPDDRARGAISETHRIHLEEIADVCLNNWQTLKAYIGDAFTEKEQKPMLEAAGAKYYRQACNRSWPQLQSLLNAASRFMDEYSPALLQGGNNMPATFSTKFKTDKALFQVKYTEFLDSAINSSGDTSAKIVANNEVYDSLIKMFADAQLIYKNDPVKKSLFVFGTLLSYVSAPKQAGLRIVAKEKVTELPVAGVSVTAQPGNVQGVTNENGVLILSLPGNSYHITGIKDGYENFVEEITITTGIISRKNVELIKSA